MPQPLLKNQYPGAAQGPAGPAGPAGPTVTGDPNALVFINTAGDGPTTSADFTATPLDPYGCPQIRDKRQAAGIGPKWRQGAWVSDGDAENVTAEGIVVYEPTDDAAGNFARIKGSRFGIRRVVPITNLDLDYAWRVDLNGQYLKNDNAVKTFEIDRANGSVRSAASIAVGPAGTEARIFSGSGSPEGAVTGRPGDLYLNITGGAGTSIYTKESGNETNTGWIGLGAPV